MPVWSGCNWQLVNGEDTQACLGVSFGMGLLDEQVEAAGTLSAALAALRTELARPVELSPGQVALPEVTALLGSDTATVTVRGTTAAVAASWNRLPAVFRSGSIPENTDPIHVEESFWPADLVQRTGSNAAAFTSFSVYPENLHDRARTVLAQLDPSAGRTRAVFFTNDQSLIGHVYPVKQNDSAPLAGTWADGTPKRSATHGFHTGPAATDPLSTTAVGNAPGVVLGNNIPVLLSVMVPRSSAGFLAAQLLNRQLAHRRGGIVSGTFKSGVEFIGAGTEFCAVFLSEEMLPERERRLLLEDFATSMTQIPDAWIGDILAYAGTGGSDRLQRERALVGLGADPAPDVADIRAAVARSSSSLHLAVDPVAPGARGRQRANDRSAGTNTVAINELRLPIGGYSRRYKSWAPRGFQGAPLPVIPALVIGRESIFIEQWQQLRMPGATAGNAADANNLLAVLEDGVGNLFVLDDKLRMAMIYPDLYFRSKALRRALDQRLAGAPRLRMKSKRTASDVAEWRRRRRRSVGIATGLVAALLGGLVAMAVVQGDRAEPIRDWINISETATLDNGTTITATRFDIEHPTIDQSEYVVNVEVNFCAGGDTRIGDLAPDAQRRVSPKDFAMLNDDYLEARLVDSGNQLREQALQPGECAIGNLVYQGQSLDVPRLAYDNAAGDTVVWYSYGKVPEQYRD
jgi:hypothetical protein